MLCDNADMLLYLLILCLVHCCWACPSSCVCKWKGGKQTVECINKSLITLPQGMDQGTQVLEFAGNNLDRLLRERFQKMGLINLQKIFLPRCRIKTIEDRAFKGLTNLIELDLSDNILSNIPTETFHDYTSLMRLNLNGNPIRIIKSNSFQPLSYLTTLDLSACGLEIIDDGAFIGLNNLEWLKLDNNKISFLKGHNILPENLHGIDLHHNPWYCNCKLLDLRNWLINYNIPQTIEPTCSLPQRVRGNLIKTLSINDLACIPEVSPTALYLEIGEGKNVTLLCRVSAIPEAKISWWFQGNVLQNDSVVAPGIHLYYYVEEGTIEKTSELYIFNTNIEDNGTFACVAENPAGKTHSNYTIRIILKEEPIINLTVFPYEYLVIVSAAGSIIAVVFVICIVLCIVQCKRQKRRKRKKDRSKATALCNPTSTDKVPIHRDNDVITNLTTNTNQIHKANGVLVNKREQEMMVYATEPCSQNSTISFSGPGVSNYQEQNPDLINDTGSKEWRPEDELRKENENITWGQHEAYAKHLTADVHLSPNKFIGPDGYPLDYGLPKIGQHYPVLMQTPAFYRTLPHKGRHTAANPGARFSREAEFLSKSLQPASYEHFNSTDVRYTAEGYPVPVFPLVYQDPFLSPPAPYKSDISPKDIAAQWPESKLTQNVTAQTSGESKEKHHAQSNLVREHPTLTESPDEGYEGETVEATDI